VKFGAFDLVYGDGISQLDVMKVELFGDKHPMEVKEIPSRKKGNDPNVG
jgi:hypothetical protein